MLHPCIRRELLKFKLTNQNSASGKNCAILVLFDVTPIVYIRIGWIGGHSLSLLLWLSWPSLLWIVLAINLPIHFIQFMNWSSMWLNRTSGEALCCFMPTSMACDELACCPNCCCIWARLVLSGWNLIVRGTIFRSSAVPNNKQSCWVFHVLGESCTTIIYQIWSGVFFQWLQLAIVLQTST